MAPVDSPRSSPVPCAALLLHPREGGLATLVFSIRMRGWQEWPKPDSTALQALCLRPQGPDPRGLRPGQLCLQPRSLSPLLRTTAGTRRRVQEAVPFLAAVLLMMSLPLSELSRKKFWKMTPSYFPLFPLGCTVSVVNDVGG